MSNLLKRLFDKIIEDFDKEFCGETFELLIITLKGVNGAAVLKNGYKLPSYYGDKEEIFADHAIEINVRKNGDIDGATLVG